MERGKSLLKLLYYKIDEETGTVGLAGFYFF
jgi:hypothetical protein